MNNQLKEAILKTIKERLDEINGLEEAKQQHDQTTPGATPRIRPEERGTPDSRGSKGIVQL